MFSKEEIYVRLSESSVSVEEGISIIRSYVFLRKNQEIDIIPPRDEEELGMFTFYLNVIKKWSA